ncbi:hypothetical protein [Cellulomonas iranensis]|uniref:hypothetical protein n=1 Tax=Cellulomonas iranensis TaxID=76862 RepID=UPI000B3CA1BA|nr:hypothetical protein [Cellulomonas iranensis]
METIHVWRGPPGTDPYGNDVHGEPIPVLTLSAFVAPNHPAEPAQVGRNAIVTGYTIYVRTPTPTGIVATDLIEVRSPLDAGTATLDERRAHLLPVDGVPAAWISARGVRRGEQLAVKVVDG